MGENRGYKLVQGGKKEGRKEEKGVYTGNLTLIGHLEAIRRRGRKCWKVCSGGSTVFLTLVRLELWEEERCGKKER